MPDARDHRAHPCDIGAGQRTPPAQARDGVEIAATHPSSVVVVAHGLSVWGLEDAVDGLVVDPMRERQCAVPVAKTVECLQVHLVTHVAIHIGHGMAIDERRHR